MKSIIADLIGMKSQPVALVESNQPIAEALEFKAGTWGCCIAMLVAASKGNTAQFTQETATCLGSKTGLGFQDFPLGHIEYFLSLGDSGKAGERYKKTPELARHYVEELDRQDSKRYKIFRPLADIQEGERPLAVIFLVNADQLSGLVTLANYDQWSQNNVKILFGSGCAQALLYPMMEEYNGGLSCYVGLTDPSARKCIKRELLSFGIPFSRFLQMEKEAPASFLTTATWQKICQRSKEADHA